MLDVKDRCRCPPPLRPRVGALFPRRRVGPLRPFGLQVQWSAPNRPAALVLPARPETTRGMAIGRFRAMASGIGKNDLKCAFVFPCGDDFGGMVIAPPFTRDGGIGDYAALSALF